MSCFVNVEVCTSILLLCALFFVFLAGFKSVAIILSVVIFFLGSPQLS